MFSPFGSTVCSLQQKSSTYTWECGQHGRLGNRYGSSKYLPCFQAKHVGHFCYLAVILFGGYWRLFGIYIFYWGSIPRSGIKFSIVVAHSRVVWTLCQPLPNVLMN